MNGIIKTGTIIDRFVEKNQRILEAISFSKRQEVLKRAWRVSSDHEFYKALQTKKKAHQIGLIAEIKRAAPLVGTLREDMDVKEQARIYEKGGATAISVLTQPLDFHGSLKDLKDVCNEVSLPVLRKEFIIDPYQIYEAKEAGASAVLLIAMILEKNYLLELKNVCKTLEIDALVEVHDEQDLEKTLSCDPSIVGVNARNLRDLSVDIGIIERILPQIPDHVIRVAESGIIGRKDVERVRQAGADAFLVGTVLIQCGFSVGKMRELMSL